MGLKNTDQSYGLMSKSLHWTMALIILGMLSIGFFMGSMEFSPLKLQIFGLHKSFGMLILMLAGFRILWKGLSFSPRDLPSHRSWERALAKLVHILLYVAMIGMPLSGWLMSSAGDFPNIFFGLFEVPALTGKDETLFKLMRTVHGTMALGLIVIIGLHVVGALKHHFIDRDETLQRMSTRALGVVGGALLALLAGALLALPAWLYVSSELAENSEQKAHVQETSDARLGMLENLQSADSWQIIKDKSAIAFEVTQYGQPFSGGFKDFSGEIVFDPQDLENSHARITIDIASIFTGSKDRDAQARGNEWFYTAQFPHAVFETTGFEVRKPNHTNPNHYTAIGNLTIRDVTLPLQIPFSLSFEQGEQGAQRAIMDAQIALNRLDFGVGQGAWESAETIGDEVSLDIHVEADQPGAP
ncbi:MAG: YceI family protein [Alphaproteobacteria bacterium]|nr:YceI family protein [Alphaproteobacteria bacterium]